MIKAQGGQEATDTRGILRQNLVDAGCSPEAVRQCAVLAQRKENGELLIIPDAVHTDLYDRTDIIPFDKLAEFFKNYLK